MPLTTSTTYKAIHKIIIDTSTYYKPGSTNSKPMYKLEQLFVQAINNNKIKSKIMDYMLQHITDYE